MWQLENLDWKLWQLSMRYCTWCKPF